MLKPETLDFVHMGNGVGDGKYNTQHVIEDFMKTEYEEGFRNEFNSMDALINKLPKDTITGKKKYKSFKLGISADHVRAVGSGTFDRYELQLPDFEGRGASTVDAEFDTTKLMATFSISDEAILKGTGDGSLIDVLKDQLNDMEVSTRHTYQRYIYGSHTGLIGEIKANKKVTANVLESDPDVLAGAADVTRDNRGVYHNVFRNGLNVLNFEEFANSYSLIPGMGCLVCVKTADKEYRFAGYVWQKDNSTIHSEKVSFVVEKTYEKSGESFIAGEFPADGTEFVATATTPIKLFSRQLDDKGVIAREYTGLEDIVVKSDSNDVEYAKIFGVDRRIYTSLRSTSWDLKDTYINEEILRDMSDHLALTSPDGTSITLCSSNHRIISQIEKQMYQFKNYNITSTMGGTQLGGSGEIKFDNYVLYKDRFARDNNLYMLDQNKIGELVRRDFTWITSGEVNGVLQRRPGTEIYEGIMNKYADMYIDAWRCHAVIKNCKVNEPGQYLSYDSATGAPIVVCH